MVPGSSAMRRVAWVLVSFSTKPPWTATMARPMVTALADQSMLCQRRAQSSPTAGPGGGSEVEEPAELGLVDAGVSQQLPHLFHVGRRQVGLPNSGRAGIRCGVSGDPSPPNGLAKCSPDDGVDLADRCRGQSLLGDEAEVQPIEVRGLDLVDRHRAEAGEDVKSEQIPVAAKRRWAEVGSGLFEPSIAEGLERGGGSLVVASIGVGHQGVEHFLGVPLGTSDGAADLAPLAADGITAGLGSHFPHAGGSFSQAASHGQTVVLGSDIVGFLWDALRTLGAASDR